MSKRERNICKVCLSSLYLAKVLTTVDDELGSTTINPAVQQCTALIDELLGILPTHRRDVVIARINKARSKLIKKLPNVDSSEATVAALRVFTQSNVKSTVGTRLDFMLVTFKRNLTAMESIAKVDSKRTKALQDLMAQSIKSI
jgi:hypothetical protein